MLAQINKWMSKKSKYQNGCWHFFVTLSLSQKKKKKSKVENDLLAYARPVKEIKCSVGYAFLSTDALWSKQSTNFERGTFDYQNIPLT